MTSRVLAIDDRILKFEREVEPGLGLSLEDEHQVLQRTIRAVPKYALLDPHLTRAPDGGLVLDTRDVRADGFAARPVLTATGRVALANELIRLCRAGVCHGDVRLANVFWRGEEPLLIDFDQSSVGSLPWCLTGSFASRRLVPPVGRRVKRTYVDVSVEWRKQRLRSARDLLRHGRAGRRVRLPSRAQARRAGAEPVRTAWQTARDARRASPPGLLLPRYEWSVAGLTFPGAQPWSHQWADLSHLLPWRGARVLEVGCELGLLSIHATRAAGAVEAVGVDGDPRLVAAASEVANWHDAGDTRFVRLDLGSEGDLGRLAAMRADIVTLIDALATAPHPLAVTRSLPRDATVLLESRQHDRDLQHMAAAGFIEVRAVESRSGLRRSVLRSTNNA